MIKTTAEVDALKQNWLNDPCWDIETTEGFEDHHDNLLAFRLEREAAWQRKRSMQLAERAVELGVPGNLVLALYVEKLEDRIGRLESLVDEALTVRE